MKVYVINLASSTQRMAAMQTQLDGLGLTFERVEAVLGKALTADELQVLYDPASNRQHFYRPLSPGEIGCYASHLRLWQRMVDESVSAALVLEDDMVLDARVPEMLERLQTMPGDWDMVKLIGMRPAEAARAWPLMQGFALVDCKRLPSLTGAYAIRLSGARKLSARAAPFSRPIDVELRHHWEFGLKVLAVDPYPARESELGQQTTIGFSRRLSWNERGRKWLYQFRYSIRNAWARWRSGGVHNPLQP